MIFELQGFPDSAIVNFLDFLADDFPRWFSSIPKNRGRDGVKWVSYTHDDWTEANHRSTHLVQPVRLQYSLLGIPDSEHVPEERDADRGRAALDNGRIGV